MSLRQRAYLRPRIVVELLESARITRVNMADSYRRPWDFFISYASEDRDTAATPLANELTSRGFSVWLDHQVLDKDDRLEKQIELGLRQCHAGIVIVSPHFVRKDWPLRELDTLLSVETLDGRLRVVPVLYNLKASQLQDTAPTLCQRATIDLATGLDVVCDKIFELIATAADRDRQSAVGPLGTQDLPGFRAPGVIRCPSLSCTWRLPAELEGLGPDPGPEFTLRQVDSKWCIVCGSCGSTVGWLTLDEAKEIVSKILVESLWKPKRTQSEELAMPRSAYLELLDEEASIPKGARGEFTFEELRGMLDARKALLEKIEAAKERGELTTQQHDQLMGLVRKHIFPPAAGG
jgi:TIR domain-containing protein